MKLESKSKESVFLVSQGIETWNELLEHLRHLSYGRPKDTTNLLSVIKEKKGTCSSKHALAKLIADQNGFDDVELILCFYKMDGINTPGVGAVLKHHQLDYIPEAHCYLKENGRPIDITNQHSSTNRITSAILFEELIQANEIGELKVSKHKSYLAKWISEERLTYTLDELWEIREGCIAALSS